MRLGSFSLFFISGGLSIGAGLAVLNFQLRHSPRDLRVQENRAAEAVAQGHAIVFPHGMNEAAFRWALAEKITTTPDIVVLGSSHGQFLSHDFFPAHHLLNLAMAGGSLSDDLVSSEILHEHGHRPRHWLVFADPWLFESSRPFMPNWTMRAPCLAAIDRQLAETHQPGHFAAELANFRAAQTSVGYQLDPILNAFDQVVRQWTDWPVKADAASYRAPIIRADGSLDDRSMPSRRAPEIAALALRQFNEKIDRHRYGSFAEIDSDSVRVFANWIRFLQQGDEHVTLIFAPYHPEIYSRVVASNGNRLIAVDEIFRRIARQSGCEVLGNYDPDKAGVSVQDFTDGDHLNTEGLRKIFHAPQIGLSQQ